MPRDHYVVPSYQQTPLWGFEREVAMATYEEHPFAWDNDGTLIATMKLSRLVVDNGYTPEFAARIVDHADGEQQVIPQWLHRLDLLPSYRLRYDRDWLTAGDAAALGQLVDAYWQKADGLPRQVKRALNLSEGVTHTNVYERALVLMMMALEALLNTNPGSVSKRFGRSSRRAKNVQRSKSLILVRPLIRWSAALCPMQMQRSRSRCAAHISLVR